MLCLLSLTLAGCSLGSNSGTVKDMYESQAASSTEAAKPIAIENTEEININNMPDNSQIPMFAGNSEIASSTDQELVAKYDSAILHTSQGDITVKFYGADSPKTVANFIKLSLVNFYDGIAFHRIIKDFMIQGGDPNTKGADRSRDGQGGPGYQFADEFNSHPLVAGSLAMANAGPNTNGSQFFIVTAASTPWLDRKHTNFGQVTAGMEIVRKIEALPTGSNDQPLTEVRINSVELVK